MVKYPKIWSCDLDLWPTISLGFEQLSRYMFVQRVMSYRGNRDKNSNKNNMSVATADSRKWTLRHNRNMQKQNGQLSCSGTHSCHRRPWSWRPLGDVRGLGGESSSRVQCPTCTWCSPTGTLQRTSKLRLQAKRHKIQTCHADPQHSLLHSACLPPLPS